jgi:hypothetical protein
MSTEQIYTRPNKFKSGWVAGFYDAFSDDGQRYLRDVQRFGVDARQEDDFMSGYREGLRARLGPSLAALADLSVQSAA